MSPQDWINELSLKSMSHNLNFTVFQLLNMSGIQTRSMNTRSGRIQFLPNPQLEELLFNECEHRQHQFILHCPIDHTFIRSLHSTHNESDGSNGVTNENSDNSNTSNHHETDEVNEMDEMNEYKIPWDRIEYEQLPVLYKVEFINITFLIDCKFKFHTIFYSMYFYH